MARIAEAKAPDPVTAEMSDQALRSHVQAQDAAMGQRLADVEAALRKAINGLDVDLRGHTQSAVSETVELVTGVAERLHLLETARGLAGSPFYNFTYLHDW